MAENPPKPKIEDLFLGFMARVQGEETKESIASLKKSLAKKGFDLNEAEFIEKLKESKNKFIEGDSHIYICTGKSCGEKLKNISLDSVVKPFKHGFQGKYSLTKCQGHCDNAPALAFRVGKRAEIFTDMKSETDLEDVLDYCKKAAKERTLLIPMDSAGKFRHDPVEDHGTASPEIKVLDFLVGKFRGIGTNHFSGNTFYKDVFSYLEPEGNFITLDMAASYKLDNGFNDVHYAKNIISFDNNKGYSAISFLTNGAVKSINLNYNDGELSFEDEIPHNLSDSPEKAIKTICKTKDGYKEKLILKFKDGSEKEYYTVDLKKI